MHGLTKKIEEAVTNIRPRAALRPKVGLILGSGLGVMVDSFEDAISIPYPQIPFFPVPSVEGHSGNLVLGHIEGVTAVAMQGRLHYYEHGDMQEVTFPLRVMIALGIEMLIVTNACGGINPAFYPGAIMIIRDHINFMGANPLVGKNHDNLGPRFPDMSEPYHSHLIRLTQTTAQAEGIEIFSGVYCAVSGPHYSTRAELRMYRYAGADAIGMSTIPEVITANHAGIPVLGISCITDMAIPEKLTPLTHEEVIRVANQTKPTFIRLIRAITKKL